MIYAKNIFKKVVNMCDEAITQER